MKHTKEGALLTSIILEIFKLNGLLVNEGDRLIKELGLSSARWKVLGALLHTQHPLTVPDIAREMGQTRQAVQRLSNEMKKDGLLETEINPNHKRAKFLKLTDKGKHVCALLDSKQIPWVNSIAKGLEAEDLEVTNCILNKIINRFENNTHMNKSLSDSEK